MFRYFDASFFAGGALTVAAVAVAYLALTNASLPLVGGARGALIAVAVLGFVACPVGGISQAPVVGWANPAIVLGCVFGILALAVIAAGLFGWDGVVRPVAQWLPASLAVDVSTERLAIAALGAIMVAKLAIGVVMNAGRGMTAG